MTIFANNVDDNAHKAGRNNKYSNSINNSIRLIENIKLIIDNISQEPAFNLIASILIIIIDIDISFKQIIRNRLFSLSRYNIWNFNLENT